MEPERILLAHGSGGKLSYDLIRELFLPPLHNPILATLADAAIFSRQGMRLAITTDSYVVDPIFFPGGDIGKLAIYGTVNDLAMGGAKPLYLSIGFILEEGFPLEELRVVVNSIKEAAQQCGVDIIAGDTKVVPRGKGDKVFINTTGLGAVSEGVELSVDRICVGDKIIINGFIGEHGIAVMTQREGLEFDTPIKSDAAPLWGLVSQMLGASQGLHLLRDPTRGGVATVLNEVVGGNDFGIRLEEEALPIGEEVAVACEILGLDPLYVANEGKLIAFCQPDEVEPILKAMKRHPYGRETKVIGEVVAAPPGKVIMKTRVGGTRLLDMLTGEQLPRIC
ncbi:MAG: hydrogenase expression/formation protein HypE [Candidatus Aminicenantes bacterium]|nr:hydrogenase expression/formation protein HypE [Candidatus Aminicenantes bacterium]MDH5715214.1 hydrogenase expression/formation protein HypE [Candidatus Aminicenantes bacterium]